MQVESLQRQLEISNNHLVEMMRNMEGKVLSGEREMKRSVVNTISRVRKVNI